MASGDSRHPHRGLRIQARVNNSLRRRGPRYADYSAVNPVVKIFLFVFNLVIMAAAGFGATLGIIVLNETRPECFIGLICDFCLIDSCPVVYLLVPLFVIAFCGCYGALRENILFLTVYHVVCSTILLVEIAAVIIVCIIYFDPEALETIGGCSKKRLEEAIIKYFEDDHERKYIDDFQKNRECCGVSYDDEGYVDWGKNVYFNCDDSNNISPQRCSVPFSCCKHIEGGTINYQCGAGMLRNSTTAIERESKIYTRGCQRALWLFVGDNIWLICGVIVLCFFLQIVIIFFARALISQIEEQIRKWR